MNCCVLRMLTLALSYISHTPHASLRVLSLALRTTSYCICRVINFAPILFTKIDSHAKFFEKTNENESLDSAWSIYTTLHFTVISIMSETCFQPLRKCTYPLSYSPTRGIVLGPTNIPLHPTFTSPHRFYCYRQQEGLPSRYQFQ